LCEACVYESGLGSSLILSGKAIWKKKQLKICKN
jgi:hypothetical protein